MRTTYPCRPQDGMGIGSRVYDDSSLSSGVSSSSSSSPVYDDDYLSPADLGADLRLRLSVSPPSPRPRPLRGKLDSNRGGRKRRSSLFVKVYMEGVAIGRKLDLLQHEDYNGLICALGEMFGTTLFCSDGGGYGHGHVLTYEDKEGDWMMVGDVPWEPTAVNLIPIRLDIEIDGQVYKDAFTWNLNDPDSEVVHFAKRTAKDLKLPPAFVMRIAASIQSQLADFRSYEGQDMFTGEKIVTIKLDLRVNHTIIKDQFLWDFNNVDGDPEEFALTFCNDMGIQDREVPPAIAFAIREQLYEAAVQSVVAAKESRMHKKRRGSEYLPASKTAGTSADVMKLFKYSVVRKRKDWEVHGPVIDFLSNEELQALEAREDRNTR